METCCLRAPGNTFEISTRIGITSFPTSLPKRESIREESAAQQCGYSLSKKASCGQRDSHLRASARRAIRMERLSKW